MFSSLKTIASVVALSGAIALPAAPAFAGGSIGFTLAPRTEQDARVMDFGLRAYALYQGLKGGGARIDQRGQGNTAGVAQQGVGNVGLVSQRGDGHAAALQQSGNGNSYGIFQFGRNTETRVAQEGNSNTGAAFTFGW
ncbi:curlin [Mesorhizobium sp. BR1-1-16]|uniref:curlin n=1 Tax=Mesorhizobium sp. BR1-1-16 TaxID=2876653 RepID=UPI001CCB61BB|nr:curlin [Mesorhizobium sp. BR1-1-16]MBZ9938760.1 curlin [Mesorhizobium sp. BR1-1-16]